VELPFVIALNFAVGLTLVFIFHQLTVRRDQQNASESLPTAGRRADRIDADRQRVMELHDKKRLSMYRDEPPAIFRGIASPDMARKLEEEHGATAAESAERTARRLRWSHLPTEDKADLQDIQALLTQAMDAGNPEAHRLNLYGRLQIKIRGLNDRHGAQLVPAKALAQVEAQARLALTAGTSEGAHR
jgi:hypothetical protein